MVGVYAPLYTLGYMLSCTPWVYAPLYTPGYTTVRPCYMLYVIGWSWYGETRPWAQP